MHRLLSVIVFILLSCDSAERPNTNFNKHLPIHKSGNLSLFIHIGYEQQFTLVVNDSLKFTTTYPGATDEGPQILIDVIPKISPVMKFKIHIAERDTTVSYNVQDLDSLRFGLFANNRFMISSGDQHVWFYD